MGQHQVSRHTKIHNLFYRSVPSLARKAILENYTMSLKTGKLPPCLTLPHVNELRDAFKISRCYQLTVGTMVVYSPFQRPWDVDPMFVDPNRDIRSPRRLHSARCISIRGRYCPARVRAFHITCYSAAFFHSRAFTQVALLFVSAPIVHPRSHNFARSHSMNYFCGRTLWDATSVAA